MNCKCLYLNDESLNLQLWGTFNVTLVTKVHLKEIKADLLDQLHFIAFEILFVSVIRISTKLHISASQFIASLRACCWPYSFCTAFKPPIWTIS